MAYKSKRSKTVPQPQLFVTAKYEGEIGERRERRIHDVFERCGVRMPVLDNKWQQIGHADVEWCEDKTGHELKIHVGEDRERANRLASELRACGMMVGIGTEGEVE